MTLCLNEIQVVPGWERFVRRLLDGEKIDVFMSGSSAALLPREIATAMRRRAWEVLIHPFSFEEHLRARGIGRPRRLALPSARERTTLEAALHAYLGTGRFREVQALDPATRSRVLRDYVDVAVSRDAVERHEVTNVTGLHWLVRHVLGNAGSLFSVESFFGVLREEGRAIGKDAVHDLLAHLTDCFLVRDVSSSFRCARTRARRTWRSASCGRWSRPGTSTLPRRAACWC